MSDIVIAAEKLGKKYRIRHEPSQPYTALRDVVAAKGKTSLQWMRRGGRSVAQGARWEEDFWALRDVSFDVRRGDAVGIVGGNGAGKSTLLKVLSRIVELTEGRARIRGLMASLLEVGTGFHAELTGRENIFLNGAILGMKRAEIRRKFDEIVAFAEVDSFIDTPVKRYSSGMYMRLAFAVAAHLEPEILIVDEVLAVGDAQFQRKCLGKMGDVVRGGRTVLFVSHNMSAVQRLCNRGLLLERGSLVDSGPIHKVVERYQAGMNVGEVARFDARKRSGLGWARVTDVRLLDESFHPIAGQPCDTDLVLQIDLALSQQNHAGASLRGLIVELAFLAEDGQPLFSVMNVDDHGAELPPAAECRLIMRLAGPTFVPGRYRVNVFLGIPNLQHVDEIPDALTFEVYPPQTPWRPYELFAIRGHVCRKAEWSCGTTTVDHTAAAAANAPDGMLR